LKKTSSLVVGSSCRANPFSGSMHSNEFVAPGSVEERKGRGMRQSGWSEGGAQHNVDREGSAGGIGRKLEWKGLDEAAKTTAQTRTEGKEN
jgi:hypothetical protein